MTLARYAAERHKDRGWCVIDRQAGGIKVLPAGHYWDSKRTAEIAATDANARGLKEEGRIVAMPTPTQRPTPPRSYKRTPPVFALVKAEPPEPARKRTVADEVRPLLEQIKDADWYQVAVYPSRSGAAVAMRYVVKALGDSGWEWRTGSIDNDQAAIFVRRR